MTNSEKMIITDCFDESEVNSFSLKLDESRESSESNVNVLGKFSGVFAIGDSISTNGRFYPKELWRRIVNSNSVKEKLKRGMLGTLEHPKEDLFIHKQSKLATRAHTAYVSHVIKSLKIIERDGKELLWGESYILNTEVGRILHSLLSATDENGKRLITMSISSRGSGLYLQKNGITQYLNGDKRVPIIDPVIYELETFDIVTSPGIKGATPVFTPVGDEKKVSINESSSYEILDEGNELRDSNIINIIKQKLMIELGIKN